MKRNNGMKNKRGVKIERIRECRCIISIRFKEHATSNTGGTPGIVN